MTYRIARDLRPGDVVFSCKGSGKQSAKAVVLSVRAVTRQVHLSTTRTCSRQWISLTLRFADGSTAERAVGPCRTLELVHLTNSGQDAEIAAKGERFRPMSPVQKIPEDPTQAIELMERELQTLKTQPWVRNFGRGTMMSGTAVANPTEESLQTIGLGYASLAGLAVRAAWQSRST